MSAFGDFAGDDLAQIGQAATFGECVDEISRFAQRGGRLAGWWSKNAVFDVAIAENQDHQRTVRAKPDKFDVRIAVSCFGARTTLALRVIPESIALT